MNYRLAAIIVTLMLFSRADAQEMLLGPPPELPPPDDNLGELFPVDGAEPAQSSEPDLTPFPEQDKANSSLGEWESLEPPEPEIPDGMIIYQGSAAPPAMDEPQAIETHDGYQDYSQQRETPAWVLPTVVVVVLLLALATGAAIWRQRRE